MPGNSLFTAEQRRQIRDYIPSLSNRPPGIDLAELLDGFASISAGFGASLIGVEDAGGNFAAEDLEGVLAELWTAATTGGSDTITDAGGYYGTDTIDGAFDALAAQIGGATDMTFNFAAPFVLADNDPIYAALEKLDVFLARLDNTGAGDGASLIGIQDAAAFFGGTTVEGALADVAAALGGTDFNSRNFTEGNLIADDDSFFTALDKIDQRVGGQPVLVDLTPGAEVANAIPVVINVVSWAGTPVSRVQRLLCRVREADMVTGLVAAWTMAETGAGSEVSTSARPELLIDTDASGDATVTVTDVSGAFAGTVYLEVVPVSTATNVPGTPRIVALVFA